MGVILACEAVRLANLAYAAVGGAGIEILWARGQANFRCELYQVVGAVTAEASVLVAGQTVSGTYCTFV